MAKILICDDDVAILEVMTIILEKNDYEVVAISSGKGIQKIVTKVKPDLILMDIWMPGIDGKEITKILKKDKVTKNIPILIISALGETKKIASEIGAEGFISKPFNIDELLSIVQKYLKNSKKS